MTDIETLVYRLTHPKDHFWFCSKCGRLNQGTYHCTHCGDKPDEN